MCVLAPSYDSNDSAVQLQFPYVAPWLGKFKFDDPEVVAFRVSLTSASPHVLSIESSRSDPPRAHAYDHACDRYQHEPEDEAAVP